MTNGRAAGCGIDHIGDYNHPVFSEKSFLKKNKKSVDICSKTII